MTNKWCDFSISLAATVAWLSTATPPRKPNDKNSLGLCTVDVDSFYTGKTIRNSNKTRIRILSLILVNSDDLDDQSMLMYILREDESASDKTQLSMFLLARKILENWIGNDGFLQHDLSHLPILQENIEGIRIRLPYPLKFADYVKRVDSDIRLPLIAIDHPLRKR